MAGLPALLHAQAFRFEAELGVRTGVDVSTSVPGYSGSGYVTGFDGDNDALTINANVPPGLYELWVGYNSRYGHKGYGVQVGDERGDGYFDGTGQSEYAADRAGLFQLDGSNNALSIRKSWGYYDIDYLELRPATAREPAPVAPTLVDPLATPATQTLMSYLTETYGQKTLAGQQGYVGSGGSFPSPTYLARSAGLVPALRGSDFIEYSPSRRAHGASPNGETERIIDWAQQTGGVVSMMWHWNAPTDLIDQPGKEWWRGFYADATTFDVAAALSAPGSAKYDLLVSDIDAIAGELQKFQAAGVPVIWRPLHEAQGNPESAGGAWFWWGAQGPQPFKQLWRLMHDRLTNVHGLHNLIWEYTSSDAYEGFEDWYPGDDVVDMVGLDIYTDRSSSMSGAWLNMLDEFDGKKLIALSETGTLPDPALFDERGIRWSYFSPWQADGGSLGVTSNYTAAELQAVLGHQDVITLDELPVMPWSFLATADADFDQDGVVSGSDFLLWQRKVGEFDGDAADPNGDGYVDGADLAVWLYQFGAASSGAGPAVRGVPEPAARSAIVWAIAALLATARRQAGAPEPLGAAATLRSLPFRLELPCYGRPWPGRRRRRGGRVVECAGLLNR
jgi:mannan endo-1,4-beta-mannosidase